MRYSAYSLSIQSELALPELLTDDKQPAGPPDVNVRICAVSPNGLPDGQQLGSFLWASPDCLWFHVPQVARFLVQHGKTIHVDPEPGIDEDSVRVFLLGSALGALMFQRGHLVLHGNAIQVGRHCMVCVGQSGAGKSTLAAGFMQRGYSILSDDVVPVDIACLALPGFPRIKLWQDTADKLGIDTDGLRRIRPDTPKFNYPLGDQFSAEPLPIRWIYTLDKDALDTIRCDTISGMHRFMPLLDNTYRVSFLQGMELQAEHLALCGQLAGKIRLARVTRPASGFELNALIDYLLADMAANP